MAFIASVRAADGSRYWLTAQRGDIRVWRVTDFDREALDDAAETVEEALTLAAADSGCGIVRSSYRLIYGDDEDYRGRVDRVIDATAETATVKAEEVDGEGSERGPRLGPT
jgi:hypothetical protein